MTQEQKAEQLVKDLNSEITELSQDIQTQHTELLECYAKEVKIETELDSLKKVYNDLAESHAKQVIELEAIKNDNEELKLSSQYRYDALLLKLEKEVDFWETEWKMKDKVVSECFIEANINYQRYAEKISYLESELLKGKELLTNILNTYRIGTKHHNKIQKFINKRP